MVHIDLPQQISKNTDIPFNEGCTFGGMAIPLDQDSKCHLGRSWCSQPISPGSSLVWELPDRDEPLRVCTQH
jgi:hypothetical protein